MAASWFPRVGHDSHLSLFSLSQKRVTDPIADRFVCMSYYDRTIVAIADGCGYVIDELKSSFSSFS